MIEVETQIIVHCRKIRVWEYISDPDNAPEWYENIQSVEWQTPKPATLGSRISFVVRFMRRELRYTYKITEWVPLEKVTMETAEGPFPMKTVYAFRSLDEETMRISLRNTGGPRGFSRLFSRFIAWMMRKANRKGLERLKEILEDHSCAP